MSEIKKSRLLQRISDMSQHTSKTIAPPKEMGEYFTGFLRYVVRLLL